MIGVPSAARRSRLATGNARNMTVEFVEAFGVAPLPLEEPEEPLPRVRRVLSPWFPPTCWMSSTRGESSGRAIRPDCKMPKWG